MIKKTVGLSVLAGMLLLTGCVQHKLEPKKVVTWETLEYAPQLEACSDISKKYLKTYSFMQIIEELGSRDNVKFIFTPSSEDILIEDMSFPSWNEALFWLDQQREYDVKIYGYANKNMPKTLEIKKITPSFFEMTCDSHIEQSLEGYAISEIGHLKVADNLNSVVADFNKVFDFSNKYASTERYLNELYYYVKENTKDELFFNFDAKSKNIYLSTTSIPVFETPYKMRIFKNYLDVNNIAYVETQDKKGIAVHDNFLLWKKAELYLAIVNKYSNNVYGVNTDAGYYEIADGKYPAKPLAIELISWTPYGEREFNVYYNDKSRKIITKDRDFSFFTEDTKAKFTIRTY